MNNFQSRPADEISAIQAAMAKRYGYGEMLVNERHFYYKPVSKDITRFDNTVIWRKVLDFIDDNGEVYRTEGIVFNDGNFRNGAWLRCFGYINGVLSYCEAWIWSNRNNPTNNALASHETALGLVMRGLEDEVKKG